MTKIQSDRLLSIGIKLVNPCLTTWLRWYTVRITSSIWSAFRTNKARAHIFNALHARSPTALRLAIKLLAACTGRKSPSLAMVSRRANQLGRLSTHHLEGLILRPRYNSMVICVELTSQTARRGGKCSRSLSSALKDD